MKLAFTNAMGTFDNNMRPRHDDVMVERGFKPVLVAADDLVGLVYSLDKCVCDMISLEEAIGACLPSELERYREQRRDMQRRLIYFTTQYCQFHMDFARLGSKHKEEPSFVASSLEVANYSLPGVH